MLLWAQMYKCLFKTLISILLGVYSEVALLDHTVILFLIFWGTSILFFHSGCTILQSYQEWISVLVSPHPHQHLFSIFLIVAILTGGLGRSPGGRHQNPFQYLCLQNPMDRGAWWATVQRACRTPWTEEPGGLQSKGLLRGVDSWIDLACMHSNGCEVFLLALFWSTLV